MKYILYLLIFVPSVVFCQSEREQKLAFRQNVIQNSSTNNETSTKSQYNKSIVKNEPINNFQYVSSYDFDRWDWINWGAPSYGFTGFVPSFYYDRFGLRQPSRIYSMGNGDKKVVQGQKKHFRLGLSYNTKNQLGGYFTYGNKSFFILEYSSTISSDKSSFIPNLTMDNVILWEDKKLDDIIYGGTVYVGGGVKFNSFGAYVMPGYGWEISNFQFFDEFYILSNNGRYSFPNYNTKFLTAKAGLIYDYKFLTTKLDINPFRNYINLGIGLVI